MTFEQIFLIVQVMKLGNSQRIEMISRIVYGSEILSLYWE